MSNLTNLSVEEEYKAVIAKFSEWMLAEMLANHDKGGRVGENGYMTCNSKDMLTELYYHVGKLQSAILSEDPNLIKEHCADIANLAMMTCDINFVLAPIPFKHTHALASANMVDVEKLEKWIKGRIDFLKQIDDRDAIVQANECRIFLTQIKNLTIKE